MTSFHMSDYTFNNLGRIGSDTTDNTQRNLQNTRVANYMLSQFFSESITDSDVKFATQQPTMVLNGMANGNGLSGNLIDYDSLLMIKTEQERPLERIMLMPRPFTTVPYLGRGSCNPDLESQLLQGDSVSDKKSVSTIMDKSFMGYTLYPVDAEMDKKSKDSSHLVEEAALDGWTRGGVPTRDVADSKKN